MFYKPYKTVPVGTNLAILQMWTMLNGSYFTKSRCDFPRLEGKMGFQRKKVDGYGEPFVRGIWRINECIAQMAQLCFVWRKMAKP